MRVCKFLLTFVSLSYACCLYAQQSFESVIDQFNYYTTERPIEKIYVFTSKPSYVAGEDLWYSTFLLNGATHQPDSMSRVVYVDLLDEAGSIVNHSILFSPNGFANGNFYLPDSLHEGNYVLRAYTNYQRNFGEDAYFIKEISIIKADEELPAVAPSTTASLQLFPEGGNFVARLENRIAFKVEDSYGRGLDGRGVVLDETGEVIQEINTVHNGMGFFTLTPNSNAGYEVLIDLSDGRKVTKKLPDPDRTGVVIRTLTTKETIKNIIQSSLEDQTFYLVAQSRGVLLLVVKSEITNGIKMIDIPKANLPDGVTQLTLFTEKGLPVGERLIFLNRGVPANLAVSTDEEGYRQRQKVNMTFSLSDRDGKPVSGNFAVSVYDQEAPVVEDFPITIENYLLLTSEIMGRIENPGYYFRDQSDETASHADLLMMTHGWRRFTWKQVLDFSLDTLHYYNEFGIPVSGKIGGKNFTRGTVRILNTKNNLNAIEVETSEGGWFYTDELVYYDSTELFIQTSNSKGAQAEIKFTLDPFHSPPAAHYTALPYESGSFSTKFLDRTGNKIKVDAGFRMREDAKLLEEVVVTDRKYRDPSKTYQQASATIDMKDIPSGINSFIDILRGRVPGVSIVNDQIVIRNAANFSGYVAPLFLLNGIPTDFAAIDLIPVTSISTIDILKGADATVYGSRAGGGVVAVYTKKGVETFENYSKGTHLINYPGFHLAKEFYAPDYDTDAQENSLSDYRTTLYWEPNVRLDETGRASISFFTGDNPATYKIVIEGITDTGFPIIGKEVAPLSVQP